MTTTRSPLTPRRWLLIDAAGAALSVVLLGFVLPAFQSFFSIPLPALYTLAVIPAGFLCIDLLSFFFWRGDARRPLRFIAICNLLYCLAALGFAFYHAGALTIWGWLYICADVSLVALIAAVELRVALR